MQVSEAERAAMHRALALAETVRGRTSPNPAVGAVILDATGALAGEGATQPAGGPHAEVVALAGAGSRARGGTAVVTLEPCAHTGRTGAVRRRARRRRRRAGRLRRRRPQPGGRRRRRQADAAGVEVVAGLDRRPSCRRRAAPLAARAAVPGARSSPGSIASTLDGRVAAADRTSRWISSAVSRADAHALAGRRRRDPRRQRHRAGRRSAADRAGRR